MKKTYASQQYVSKGNFGHDLSNSLSNVSLDRTYGKKTDKIAISKDLVNPYLQELQDQEVPLQPAPKQQPSNDSGYSTDLGDGIVRTNKKPIITLTKHSINDNETFNDADDEKDSGTNTGSNCVSADSNLGSSDIGERSSIPIKSLPEFEKITKSLLQQLKVSRNEAKQNRDLAQQLSNDLATITRGTSSRKVSTATDALQNFENIISFYGKKFEDMDRANKENLSRMVELENTFNNIQRFQSNVYQNHLKELDSLITQKNEDLQELRREYQQLEQWVLALFKEVGDRAKSWSNHEFLLTTNEISKSLRPPVKKSNLELLYRYLIQFLYLEEAEEVPAP